LAGYLNGAKISRIVVCGIENATYMSHPGIWKNEISIKHPLSVQARLIFLAGPESEFRYTGRKDMHCATEDIRLLRASLKIKNWNDDGVDESSFYEQFSKPANQFVNHPIRWKMIDAFAIELQQRKTLTGQEAVSFLMKETDKLSSREQLEFFYPQDGLGGDMLPLSEHGK